MTEQKDPGNNMRLAMFRLDERASTGLPFQSRRSPVLGTKGVVSTTQPLAFADWHTDIEQRGKRCWWYAWSRLNARGALFLLRRSFRRLSPLTSCKRSFRSVGKHTSLCLLNDSSLWYALQTFFVRAVASATTGCVGGEVPAKSVISGLWVGPNWEFCPKNQANWQFFPLAGFFWVRKCDALIAHVLSQI